MDSERAVAFVGTRKTRTDRGDSARSVERKTLAEATDER